MNKFCPISQCDCGDKCMMYDWDKGGCLIKKALKLYIENGEPVKAKRIPPYKPYDKENPMEGLCLIP